MVAESKILFIGKLHVDQHWKMRDHKHGYYELVVVLEGALEVYAYNQKYNLQAGDCILYVPETIHSEIVPPMHKTEFYYFGFDISSFSTQEILCQDQKGRIRILLQWLHEEHKSIRGENSGVRVSFANALIEEFYRIITSKDDDLFSTIRQFMRNNIAAELTIKTLAKRAKLSEYYFIRRYKAITGMAPMQDLQRMRIDHAIQLLITTDKPLKQIAAETGFKDVAYFCRVFNQITHSKPSVFRGRQKRSSAN